MNNKYLILIIASLLVVIALLLNKCDSGNNDNVVVYKTTTDTAYVEHDTTIFRDSPIVYSTDTVKQKGDTVFIIDTTYLGLKKQYEDMIALYSVRNIYKDSIPIDSLGYVHILDTVQYNTLQSKTFRLDYSIPIITNTTVLEPKNLFYVGAGFSMAQSKFRQIQANLLYKPKKNIFGIHIGSSTDGTIYYGGSVHLLINKK